MHNSFYWRRNRGTGTGTDTMVCALSMTIQDTPIDLSPANETYTITMNDPAITMTVADQAIGLTPTDDPTDVTPNC